MTPRNDAERVAGKRAHLSYLLTTPAYNGAPTNYVLRCREIVGTKGNAISASRVTVVSLRSGRFVS